MSTIPSQLPGQRETVHVGGYNFLTAPESIKPRWEEAFSVQRRINGVEQVGRLRAFEGCPEVILKYLPTLVWGRLTEEDREFMTELLATPGSLDFTDWKPITEIWYGDGTTTAFTCSRRLALLSLSGSFHPTGASTIYATATTDAGSAVTPTFGTVDANYRQPFTLSVAPADGAKLKMVYSPLYRMRRLAPDFGYQIPHLEGATLALAESF